MNVTTVVIFLAAVSAVTGLAAWVGEGGLRRTGAPTRWIWLAAMAAPTAWLVASTVAPGAPAAAASAGVPIPVVDLAPLQVAPPRADALTLDAVVAGAWLALSAVMILVLVAARRRLERERRGWRHADVRGRAVYVSENRGPAVAGTVRPWIVLPRWVLGLPEAELALVVMHEEEHLRGRDPLLLGLALALVAATPWNPISWWKLRRLRTAVEIDCDTRVLRRAPDPGRYGRSLLSVAERSSGPSLGLAAFAERPLSLERRLLAMTGKRSRWTPVTAGLLVVLALVVGVQACAVEINIVTGDREEDADAPAATSEIPISSEEVGVAPVAPPAPPVAPPSAPPVAPPSASPAAPPSAPPVGPREPGPTPGVEGEEPTPEDVGASPRFTPFTVAPSILNRAEIIAEMQDAYPPLLRDAGVGGTVRVYFFIGASGTVEDVRIDESSGHPALDAAALRVASLYRFSPALNRDERVPVWVSFPITFQVR